MKKFVTVFLSLLLAVLLCSACTVYIDDNNVLIVHFLDVGQGDAVFAELPNGQTMLIDAGESYCGAGIIQYIKDAGYRSIDYLVATHPHADHIGGMPYIVRHFDVGRVFMPKVSANTTLFESLVKSLISKKRTVKNGKAGVTILEDGDLRIDILAPSKIVEDNLNNCSIVLKLTYGSTSFLLTGDAETEELGAIQADMQADVLKAAHHGSKTSYTQSILQAIHPEITVISCGKNNDYGHPHKEVLNGLKAVGSSVYRTDRDKTVIITSDGSTLSVSTDMPSIMRDEG